MATGEGGGQASPVNPPLLQQRAMLSANTHGYRGHSRKLQDMLRQQGKQREKECKKERIKFEPHNWRTLGGKEISRMGDLEKSRYMAYEPLSKDIQEKQLIALERVRAAGQAERQRTQRTLAELIEARESDELVGQLKASEAKRRIRSTRMGLERDMHQEIEQLIRLQPSAMKAVRLKTMMNLCTQPLPSSLLLNKAENKRVQTLIEDNNGYTINRHA